MARQVEKLTDSTIKKLAKVGEPGMRANRMRQRVADGVDPLEERAAQEKAKAPGPTLWQACESLIAARWDEWRNAKHAAQ